MQLWHNQHQTEARNVPVSHQTGVPSLQDFHQIGAQSARVLRDQMKTLKSQKTIKTDSFRISRKMSLWGQEAHWH